MAYRVDHGYPSVDAVWFDGDGYGRGVSTLLLDKTAEGLIEIASLCALAKSGETELLGWGKCDGPCARVEREGVGYYAVPLDQWAKVEAWFAGRNS